MPVIVRSVVSDRIFLTFDDGPDSIGTPAVLDLLARKKVAATFFVVAGKLGEEKGVEQALLQRILVEGHALGNHSWDHRYRNYFRGSRPLKEWIARGEREIPQSVGFRPPAGVLTPPLLRAASELGIPIVLWSERFYDAVFPWTMARAEASARGLRAGSIVLLHDRQPVHRIGGFCRVLERYIDTLSERGFRFASLTRELTGYSPQDFS